jgi:hypothetical protein
LSRARPELAISVRRVLEENKAERHIRGGEATRAKYHGGKAQAGKSIKLINYKNLKRPRQSLFCPGFMHA